MNLFTPLSKIHVEKRLVYGIATAELPDRAGEVLDYESSKPYFERWSDEVAKATGGRSLGALRVMHNDAVAAGKLTDITFNDDEKKIEVCAKVVDNDAWAKVTEGVYTGFSQGGRYVKRWTDEETGLVRYTAEPHEISLVDLPCLPDATFEVVRDDGVVEVRKFHQAMSEPTEAENALEEKRRASTMAKAAAEAEVDALTEPFENLLAKIAADVAAIKKASEPQYAARIAKCGRRAEDEPLPAKAAIGALKKDALASAPEAPTELSAEERAHGLMKDALSRPVNLHKPMKDKG